MTQLIIAFLLLATVVAAITLLAFLAKRIGLPSSTRQANANNTDPSNQASNYKPVSSLLTAAEQVFLRDLDAVLPHVSGRVGGELRVFAKVRLSDIVRPDTRGVGEDQQRSSHARARNSIDRKHVDYVLADARGFGVRCIIELDDASHTSDSAKRRDAAKDHALQSSGVPCVRVAHSPRGYDRAALAESLCDSMRP